ncbi:Nif3-like dinuclear metal center hexameric protein [Paenibacillus endoradicis]|uniref:Nif3-like dinuclear metal center hexameric protein n=1 Tax=Paenibacillus endoradicis TaxID=2972487 RepID=UPI002158F63D|nr:Nif3-like dinuclear metal center hexameric protein [Paenibacillus endoradicis]MCR8659951.1 Nif3-like dinuclear metal center hexameric protein [Paenibacillus endoradicis]
MLVKELMEILIAPVGKLDQTVDGIIVGDGNEEVKAIGTTFVCSYEVIKKAIEKGINVIISHEPVCYNHHSEHDKFGVSKVIEQKLELLRKHSINVIRFHDYAHRYIPDIISEGFLDVMEWSSYEDQVQADLLHLPTQSVGQIAKQLKERLGIEYIQLVGQQEQLCSNVWLRLGFRGNGDNCIPAYEQGEIDLIIAGEGHEWETPEYVRDANAQGKAIALLIIGHQKSEDAGMKILARRLQQQLPQLPITHIEQLTAIQYV